MLFRSEKPVLSRQLPKLVSDHENLRRASGDVVLHAPVTLEASSDHHVILAGHGTVFPDDDGKGRQLIQKARFRDASQGNPDAVQASRAGAAVDDGDAGNIGKRSGRRPKNPPDFVERHAGKR